MLQDKNVHLQPEWPVFSNIWEAQAWEQQYTPNVLPPPIYTSIPFSYLFLSVSSYFTSLPHQGFAALTGASRLQGLSHHGVWQLRACSQRVLCHSIPHSSVVETSRSCMYLLWHFASVPFMTVTSKESTRVDTESVGIW